MAKQASGKITFNAKKSIGGHAKSDSKNKSSRKYKKPYRGQGR